MKKTILIILIVVGVALAIKYGGGALFLWLETLPNDDNKSAVIDDFNSCVAAGSPVMESYPRQCQTPDGQTFVEDIGDEFEKDKLIRIFSPRPGSVITSPLMIEGEARGTWYFEASFPVRLLDGNGVELIVAPAQAQDDWMTEEFVPFAVRLEFPPPTTPTGTLVLEKDNPSGLPEHADELRVPVRFGVSESAGKRDDCIITGCSGQVCAGEEVMTTCEFRPEYACFKSARCERQPGGQCGWTETEPVRNCLNTSVGVGREIEALF